MDFQREPVAELASQVRSKKVSAREMVSHALTVIDKLNAEVNAFVAVDPEAALSAAAAVDERVAGVDPGPLAGVPIGVKDLEDAAGFPTTYGSLALGADDPVELDSVLVARLKAAGCVVVGKTNTPELGWKADTENRRFGQTRNPWDLGRIPGGSSGGSAAAIASGMVPLATGSDGGGSIRIPSALCGLSGMKPSLGRVPIGGSTPPGWPGLSAKGPMARRMSDVVLALDAVVGPDPTDLESLPRADTSWLYVLDSPQLPRKVAWSPTLGYAPVDAEVLAVCERAVAGLEAMGTEVVVVDEVFAEDPMMEWLTLTGTFSARTLEPVRATAAWDKVDPMLAATTELSRGLDPMDVVRAMDRCHLLNVRLVELFRDVRLLLTPTCAGQTPRVGEQGSINGTSDMNWVRFTYPFNLTRSPAASVCAGFTADGMPVGLQMVGPQHADQVVLRSAVALEAALSLDPVAPIGV